MKAIWIPIIVGAVVCATTFCYADVLTNHDCEAGTLSRWSTAAPAGRTITASTNATFNRNYAGRIEGSYTSASMVTAVLYQSVAAAPGDHVRALGFVHWAEHTLGGAACTGMVEALLEGASGGTSKVWQSTFSGWDFFDLTTMLFGVGDAGFESGTLDTWVVGCDDLDARVQRSVVDSGDYALEMSGAFTNWSWNQVYQTVTLASGDVVEASARINIAELVTTGDWLVAGIKLEKDGGGYGIEDSIGADTNNTGWMGLSFTSAPITEAGAYVYRCMVAGGNGGVSTGTVYFDEVNLWKQGAATAGVEEVTLSIRYTGKTDGLATNQTEVYVDSITLSGATANPVQPGGILDCLKTEAEAIATNPAVDVPDEVYPKIYRYGSPAGEYPNTNYPARVEITFPGWKFRFMTNDVVSTVTNTIDCYMFLTNQAETWLEFDSYRYLATMPHVERGEMRRLDTNGAAFEIGTEDGSSAEFGMGPFPATHTYTVGTSLTNFPRYLTTDASGGWPSKLNIVYQENFSYFTNSLWNKQFVLATLWTNAWDASKAVRISLSTTNTTASNGVYAITQEIHMGTKSAALMAGRVDYPNVTYQDHNEVALRAPWLYNMADDGTGWWMQQRPRGSATIEPISIHVYQSSQWIPLVYEEYLFTWDAAASAVRSLADADRDDCVPGPASYHVGFKAGHQFGTNELGEAQYPEVINIRGNGYFRMTDYDGVMAGSFRPLAEDVFGLYQTIEDVPIMPRSYVRVVPRTTPTNEPDNSYTETYLFAHSKTNNALVSVMRADLHFTPDEVVSNGCYFDLSADTYANRERIVTNDGALAAFIQVSMHWRGGGTNMTVGDHTEGHDIDTIMLHHSDGEWISHQVLNPPAHLVHQQLGAFLSNDTVYLMQQDRSVASYGFAAESPYSLASSFEITLLDDDGRVPTLDVYEEHTASEVNDNVNIAANFPDDLNAGEHLHYAYRYRTVYAPGVTITAPNTAHGEDCWVSNNQCVIQFTATDGEDKPLRANLYYGTGVDGQWIHINSNQVINVSSATQWRASYSWDTSGITPGAYYIRAEVQHTDGGKKGFDISNKRLMLTDSFGFPHNVATESVTTNHYAWLGEDMDFESGSTAAWGNPATNWAVGLDDLAATVTAERAYSGSYSARMDGPGWSGWSFNEIYQQIPVTNGETLYVTGRVYVASFSRAPAATNWLQLGIKVEPTNGAAGSEAWLDFTTTTGVWQNLSFSHTAPYSGREHIMLYVMGHDCDGVEAYFDDISILSTSALTIVTNTIGEGYWASDVDVDVSGHNILSFRLASPPEGSDAVIWAADSAGTTNQVAITGLVDRICSCPRDIVAPWTNFAGLDRSRLRKIGFRSAAASGALRAHALVSRDADLLITGTPLSPPQYDLEGVPLYNPGDRVTNIIHLRNLKGAAVTCAVLYVANEYAADQYWWDTTHAPHQWSASARAGDPLAPPFKYVSSNLTFAAGAIRTITNIYQMPRGRRIDRKWHSGDEDWFYGRNLAGWGTTRVVMRNPGSNTIFVADSASLFSMDDNFDIDDDGLPDAYEITHSGSYTGLPAQADQDMDGYSNLQEFIADTNPTNSASYPAAHAIDRDGMDIQIWFQSATGRLYAVYGCDDIVQPVWTLLDTNDVAGIGGLQFVTDSNTTATNRFYRFDIQFDHTAWPQ